MKKVQTELSQRPGAPGSELESIRIPPQQRRKIQGMPAELPNDDGENSRLARTFEQDAPSNEQAWGESAFAKDMNTSQPPNDGFARVDQLPSAGTTNNEPKKRTRWEELRGQRGGQDSAWERIRQETARKGYKDEKTAKDDDSGLFNDRPPSEGFSEEQQRFEDEQKRRLTRDKERQEYEKMFEKESRGEDSIYRSA